MTVMTATAARTSIGLTALERVPSNGAAETVAAVVTSALRSADTVSLRQVAPAAQASLSDASALFDETTGA